MTQEFPSITGKLAAAYAKAVIHNPKDTVYANIERALADCPNIVRAVNNHEELVEALQDLRDAVHSGGFPHESVKRADAAIAKAKGE